MRNLLQCAITVAVLVSGAASQATTLAVPTNPVTVWPKSTFRAYVADLSNDVSVAEQWTPTTSMSLFTWQWDFSANSFSEEWRTGKSLLYSKDVLGG